MPDLRVATGLLAAALLCGALVGCDFFGSKEAAEDVPVVEEEGFAPGEKGPRRSANLELHLQEGDRFPLVKRVEQKLDQVWPTGLVTSHSRLEMLLAITVEEIDEEHERKRLGVKYHRVQYTQDLNGDRIEYDSSAPPATVPEGARAYQGLVENGFSFWIGADNKLQELVGFDDFLKRCVQGVPLEQRQSVLNQMAANPGEEGIANFIDDSIGLLPYNVENRQGSTVKVGDTWTQRRQVARPLPMYISNRYTLEEIDDAVARVNIMGTIAPSVSFGPSDQSQEGTEVTVRGGHRHGRCLIDRTTGLPIDSRVNSYVDMQVDLADGTRFDQRSEVITTINAYPQQSGSGGSEPKVVPATASRPSDAGRDGGTIQAGATR